MTPELAVASRLVALSPVTAIVGPRVYMLKLPQRPTLPAVRVQRISGLRGQHLRGPDGWTRTRVQVDSYVSESAADAYATVTALADAIRGDGLGPSASGLWGWIGELGSPPIRINNVEVEDDGDVQYEGDELRLLRLRQDFMLHWRE